VPEAGLIEQNRVEGVGVGGANNEPAEHLYTHLNTPLHHSNASNKTTSKIVLVTVIVSALLSAYTLLYTDFVMNLSSLQLTNFSPSNRYNLYAASLYFLHLFFGIFSMLCATTSSVAPMFGVVIVCEPVSSLGVMVIVFFKLYYLLSLGFAFLATRYRNAWYSRLLQLAITVMITDFKIHEHAKCSDDKNLGIMPSFLSTTAPYYLAGFLFSVNCFIELKLRDGGLGGSGKITLLNGLCGGDGDDKHDGGEEQVYFYEHDLEESEVSGNDEEVEERGDGVVNEVDSSLNNSSSAIKRRR